jgi:phospholipase/carboxylesterase
MPMTKLGGLDAHVHGDPAGNGPVVILLHGFGAPGDDLVPLGRAMRLPAGTRFVFPEAPLDMGFGRAWWMIDPELFMDPKRNRTREVPAGLHEARDRLTALLAEVEERLHPSKIVLGGFSQGAMVSLDAALHSARPLAGLILMSGTLIAADEWDPLMAKRAGLPVFMSHGTADPLLPYAASDELRARLVTAGLEVDWHSFRGGHEIPMQVLAAANAFVDRALR